MDHRLYIIEGLPCSGKSTACRFTAEVLRQRHTVCCVDEGTGEHPADYEFHALVPETAMAGFSQQEQEVILRHGEQTENGCIVPLAQVPAGMVDRLLPYKIYDFLPWEREMPAMLDKWQRFCDTADENTVYVFNCVLLQNPMCETMMRFGFPQEVSERYIAQIAQILQPMNPVVLYLKNEDIAQSVEKGAAERPGWLEGVIDYHVKGAYGQSINAQGFAGYIRCLQERQRRELEILHRLPVKQLVVSNPQRDWAAAYEKIREFLQSRNPG